MAFWDIFKKKDMEKLQEGDLKTKDYIERDLGNFKFQKITGGRSTKLLKVVEKNGKITLHFHDGSSTDFKLLNERYIQLGAGQPDFTIEQITQLIESRKKKARGEASALIKDAEAKAGITPEEAAAGNSVSDVTFSPIVSQRPESPLQQLLKKQKENLVSLNLTLKVNLPQKALFDVLLDSYENAEEEILNFAVSKVDIESIKTSIKEAIKKNYYKANGKSE